MKRVTLTCIRKRVSARYATNSISPTNASAARNAAIHVPHGIALPFHASRSAVKISVVGNTLAIGCKNVGSADTGTNAPDTGDSIAPIPQASSAAP